MSAPTMVDGRCLRAWRLVLFAGVAVASTDAFAGDPLIESNWVDAVSGSWSDALRWSGSTVPQNGAPMPGDRYRAVLNATGAAHTVTLDVPVAIDELVLDSEDVTLDQQSTLAIDRGELRRGRHVIGQTLTVSSLYEIGADLEFGSGAIIGAGLLSVLEGGDIEISGQRLLQNPVSVLGSMTLGESDLRLFGGGITIESAGVLQAAAGDSIIRSLTPLTTITNEGLIERAVPGTTTFEGGEFFGDPKAALDNNGIVRASDGAINVFGGGSSGGIFEAGADGVIRFNQLHDFVDGAMLSGPGSIEFSNGEYSISGNLLIDGNVTWEDVALVTGSAPGHLEVGGRLDLNGVEHLRDHKFELSTSVSPGGVLAGRGEIGDVVNEGLIHATGRLEGEINNQAGGEILITDLGHAESVHTNDGLIRAASAKTARADVLDSAGEIRVESGELILTGHDGVYDGPINVWPGASLNLGGFTTITSDLSIPSGSTLLFSGNTTLTGDIDVAGEVEASRDFSVQAGTATFSSLTTFNNPQVAIDGALIVGNADIRIIDLSGEGTTVLEPGGVWDSQFRTTVGTDFEVFGEMRAQAGSTIYLGDGTNNATRTLTIQPGGSLILHSETEVTDHHLGSQIVNNGLITFDGDAIEMEGLNGGVGTLSIPTGSHLIQNSRGFAGLIDIAEGAAVEFRHFTLEDGGVLNADGDLTFRLGTNILNGTLTGDGEVTVRTTTLFNQDQRLTNTVLRGPIGGEGKLTFSGQLHLDHGSTILGDAVITPATVLTQAENHGINISGGRLELQRDYTPTGDSIGVTDGELIIADGVTMSSSPGSGLDILGDPSGKVLNYGEIRSDGGSLDFEAALMNYGAIRFDDSGGLITAAGSVNDGLIQANRNAMVLHGMTMTENSVVDGFYRLFLQDEPSFLDGEIIGLEELIDFQSGSTVATALDLVEATLSGTNIQAPISTTGDVFLAGGGRIEDTLHVGGDIQVRGEIINTSVVEVQGDAELFATELGGGGEYRLHGELVTATQGVVFDSEIVLDPLEFRMLSKDLDITIDAHVRISSNTSLVAESGFGTLRNAGVIEVFGAGSSVPDDLLNIDNQGTISVTDGAELTLDPENLTQVIGRTIDGGAWEVSGGGRLSFDEFDFFLNAADIRISGEGSRFDQLSSIRASSGSLTLTDGASVEISPDTGALNNTGLLTLDESSGLSVIGGIDMAVGSAVGFELESLIRADRGSIDEALIGATGVVVLAGDLLVTPSALEAPAFGESYLLFSSESGIIGDFSDITLGPLPGGLVWDYQRTLQEIRLVVIPTPGSGAALLLAGSMIAIRRNRA